LAGGESVGVEVLVEDFEGAEEDVGGCLEHVGGWGALVEVWEGSHSVLDPISHLS